ncbi:cell division protein FtsQ/DivIB [Pampinifervens florentissimum]|uniref:cell division protein FtsQ/DivIB n=1 Tax=Pampinifervens florentissimum TaxID=1632019 RepID=UPI0013B48418|nr:cell division protein FtsQ [Hydrogenobacter sp. T-8]QID34035.1 cell division protein FtsQ [Hydrogenobacter sp. T-8]
MKKDGRRGKWLGYILSVLWLFSMGLSGFFFPYFTDNIEFFKIKALHIEGLKTIPSEIVVDEIKKFKNNWLFIDSTTLLKNLNSRTGNSVSSVKIDRVFSSRGVELKIFIEERKPIITVIKDDIVYFFDKNGTVFQSQYMKVAKPLVYTHDIELIKKNFSKLDMLIELTGGNLGEIYITNLNTVAYTEDGLKITMPPIFLLDKRVVEKLTNVFKVYNIDMNTKELDLNMEGLVIIRGGKVK